MADFGGKYQYLERDGRPLQEGACRVQFDAQTFTLTPESGAPLAFDLGDLDSVVAAEWEIRLALFTGRSIVLRQFAKAYDKLAQGLLEAYRERAIRCLLLEDMAEVARFTGQFELAAPGEATRSGPAEFRVYKSNLAVLASASPPFQWRLADIDAVRFDAANYVVILESDSGQLKVSRLAKRTEEFIRCVRDTMNAVAAACAQALHAAFPFLDPDQLQSLAALLREGGSAPVARLAKIDPRMPAALAAHAVDKDLQPYYEWLLARTAAPLLYAGFKLIRPEEESSGSGAAAGPGAGTAAPDAAGEKADTAAPLPGEDTSGAVDADAAGPQALYWFFFPLAERGSAESANAVAWEANASGGRATYFFRLMDAGQASKLKDPASAASAVDAALRRLNRGLALLNFRRRPIYLSDDELAMDPRYHRYAIAARRMPELRELRANFVGRAIHSSPDSWQAQVESILEKTGQ
jgi:hypothetical protein